MANVCVITGGGSGMGLEAAKFMPKDKVIVLSGRTMSKLEGAVAELESLGFTAYAKTCDTSKRESVKELVEFAAGLGEIKSGEEAIAKQKALIEEIHKRGAKVIMSSHMQTFLPPQEVLAHMKEQASRGADILKMVIKVDTEEEMVQTMETFFLLKKEIKQDYVFLANGKFGTLVRYLGLKMGVSIEFAARGYWPVSGAVQPTVSSFKKVEEGLHWRLL